MKHGSSRMAAGKLDRGKIWMYGRAQGEKVLLAQGNCPNWPKVTDLDVRSCLKREGSTGPL